MQHHVRNISRISDTDYVTDFSLWILESTKSEVCGRFITDSLTESLTDFLTDFRHVRESEKRPRTCVENAQLSLTVRWARLGCIVLTNTTSPQCLRNPIVVSVRAIVRGHRSWKSPPSSSESSQVL